MPTSTTHTTEAIQEVEDFVLEQFQHSLIRSLTDNVRLISRSSCSKVCLHKTL